MWLVGSLRSIDYGEGERVGGGGQDGVWGWSLGAELEMWKKQGPFGEEQPD